MNSSNLNQLACTSGLDRSNKDASYLELMLPVLKNRQKQCADTIYDASQQGTMQAAYLDRNCTGVDESTFPNLDRPYLSEGKTDYAKLATKMQIASTVLDSFCSPLLQHYLAYASQPSPLLFYATVPTIYVLSASGGTMAVGGSGGTSAGASGGKPPSGGGAGGATATAGIDNPTALLLYTIAGHLQRHVCKDAQATHGVNKTAFFQSLAGVGGGTTSFCHTGDPQTGVAVVPEAQWSIEDFRNQCAGDPNDTLAGVIIDGAITTFDGSFRVVTVSGGSQADFGAQVVSCGPSNAKTPINKAIYTQLISSGWTTSRVSLFLPAIVGTFIAANLSAKAGYVVPFTSTSSSAALSSASSTLQRENTNLLTGSALGGFASGISSLTIGNPNSALTLRETFENWATQFTDSLAGFCASAKQPNTPAALQKPNSNFCAIFTR